MSIVGEVCLYCVSLCMFDCVYVVCKPLGLAVCLGLVCVELISM